MAESKEQGTLTVLQNAVKFESDSFLESTYMQVPVFAKTIAELYSLHLCPTVASTIVDESQDTLYVFLDMVDVTVKEKFQYLTQTPGIQ